MRFFVAVSLAALAVGIAPASAQQQQPTPEQRIQRLERQLEQVQRRVFPRGRPADTAGFADDPAATQSSVIAVNDRLNSLERQMSEILRLSEENGQRLRTMESDLNSARAEQNRRIEQLEAAVAAAAAAQTQPVVTEPAATERPAASAPRPSAPRPAVSPPASSASTTTASTEPPSDPGEDAYTEGFRLWEAGEYDRAITSLRAFVSAFPKHRRVSWANNLAGRALLDKGEPRAAAEALLANYRSNPGGGRAPDSLYYLGQSLMRLGQPEQACKAYAELEAVYGDNMREELAGLLPAAKQEARCDS